MKVTLREAPNGATRLRVNDVVLVVGEPTEISEEVNRALVATEGVKLDVSEPVTPTDEPVRGGK